MPDPDRILGVLLRLAGALLVQKRQLHRMIFFRRSFHHTGYEEIHEYNESEENHQ